MAIDDKNADDKNAPDDTAGNNPDLVCLGRIGGAHGLRGAVRIQTFTDEPEDIGTYGPLVSPPGDRRFRVTVQRRVKSGVIARVAGVDSRHAAMELKGILLFVARDVLPPPGDDEFYHADLVGMTGVALDGTALGQVIAVWNFGAGDVLELKAAKSGKAVMLPFDQQVVPTVDLAGGVIRIDVPESLKEDLI